MKRKVRKTNNNNHSKNRIGKNKNMFKVWEPIKILFLSQKAMSKRCLIHHLDNIISICRRLDHGLNLGQDMIGTSNRKR